MISLPDDLFEKAERFAQQEGISRSELYASALRDYLQERQRKGITERIDAIYCHESSHLDPNLALMQTLSVRMADLDTRECE